MRRRGLALAVLLVASAATALSACGSDDSSGGGNSGSSGTAGVGGAGGSGANGGTAGIGASGGSAGSGGVPACAVSCDEYPLLAKAIYSNHFAIDDEYVYYGRSTNLERVPNAGGKAETVASQLSSWEFVVRDGTVYGVINKQLVSLPVTGGTPSVVYDPVASIDSFVVDDAHAYVATFDALVKVPLTGGSTTLLAPDHNYDLAVDATHAFYTKSGEVRSVPLSGGPSALVTVTNAAPERLLVDDSALYLLESDQIYRISKDGSQKTQLSGVPGHTNLRTFTQDATHLYVGTADDGCNAIAAIPKAGGPATVLADDIVDDVYWIEVDATHVYFEHRCKGARDIRRMAR